MKLPLSLSVASIENPSTIRPDCILVMFKIENNSKYNDRQFVFNGSYILRNEQKILALDLGYFDAAKDSSGEVAANGGIGTNAGSACSGGGGGGGRILITASTNSFSGTVTSSGGIASTDGLALSGVGWFSHHCSGCSVSLV